MPTLGEAARAQFLLVVAGAACVLVAASVVSHVLRARDASAGLAATLDNVDARIRAWWAMVALFAACVLLGAWAVTALFAGVSTLAVRELASNAPPRLRDRASEALVVALVAVQYGAVAFAGPAAIALAMPVFAAVTLPIIAFVRGGARERAPRALYGFRSVFAAGWCLSRVAALAYLDLPGPRGSGLLLVAWLVAVTQGSDVLQYVFGKLLGRRRVAPALSPDKTVEGLAGGVACAAALGAALSSLTPFAPTTAFVGTLALALLGFGGGLALSAAKRALRIKDWGHSIPGHGGVLDRVDSLLLPAPALYYALTASGAG